MWFLIIKKFIKVFIDWLRHELQFPPCFGISMDIRIRKAVDYLGPLYYRGGMRGTDFASEISWALDCCVLQSFSAVLSLFFFLKKNEILIYLHFHLNLSLQYLLCTIPTLLSFSLHLKPLSPISTLNPPKQKPSFLFSIIPPLWPIPLAART